GYCALSSNASSGSHFKFTVVGVASKAIRANILFITLNTKVSGPKGSPSVVPFLARQYSRIFSMFIFRAIELGFQISHIIIKLSHTLKDLKYELDGSGF